MNKISEKQTKPAIERIKSISRVLAVLSKVARVFCFVGIGVLSCGQDDGGRRRHRKAP